MAWSYGGDPSASAKDAVRFLIGDTNPKDQLLQDGEITYVLGQYNQAPPNAAIQCCEAILAKFARMVDEKVGLVDIKFSQKIKQYTQTRDELRRRLAFTDATPFAGGISVAQKETNRQNTDLVKPTFTKTMMENNQNSTFVPQSDFSDDDEQP